MDLEYAYEEGVFTLYTQSETIYRSLSKAEHQEILKAAFETIGISENGFDVKLRGKQSDNFNKSMDELKETFGGVKIDIK